MAVASGVPLGVPRGVSRGRFITLEGGEGVGKTTQARLLAAALAANRIPVIRTREPGGSEGAELLRGLLLEGGVDWAPQAETLLHFAARAEHVAKTVRPALDAGTWVVCDRFSDSTMAYQGYGQGTDHTFIAALTRLLGIAPDLTFVLDVPDDIAQERRCRRDSGDDRYERLDAAFHQRVRAGFRAITSQEATRCVLLDASGSPDAVHAAIMAVVGDQLEQAATGR